MIEKIKEQMLLATESDLIFGRNKNPYYSGNEQLSYQQGYQDGCSNTLEILCNQLGIAEFFEDVLADRLYK